MRPTRRFWSVATTTVLCCVAGALWVRPVLLVGAGGIGAWLLVRQHVFSRRAYWIVRNLRVTQTVNGTDSAEGTVRLGMHASLTDLVPVTVTVEPSLPESAQTQAEPRVAIEPGTRESQGEVVFTVPVAGTYRCGRPNVRITDTAGLFSDTIEYGDRVEFRLRPKRATDVRVGGEADIAGLLEGNQERGETTVVSSGIREYHPGDPVENIDWNATARTDGTFVRDLEVERPVVHVLVVDARDRVWRPESGVTKFEYLREVGLQIVDAIEDRGDSIGLILLSETDSVSLVRRPSAASQRYALIRQDLDEVPEPMNESRNRSRRAGPASALENRLRGDRDAFGPRLRAFFDSRRYASSVDVDPLVRAVREAGRQVTGERDLRLALLTDDSDTVAVRRAVETARTLATHVQVYLTPSVLFESRRLVDVEDAYPRYQRFEGFRDKIDSARGVTAFEVGPARDVRTVGRRAEVR